MTSWIYIFIIVVIIWWYICTRSLMMIYLLVVYLWKMLFIYKAISRANFESTLWRHRWRHHHENTYFGIICDDLFISEVKLKLCLIFQNFHNGRYFELATNFFLRKENIPERLPWAFPTFWAFDRRSSSNIDGDISLSKFDLLCDLVTSSITSWVRGT